ncbi:hypothetical protein RFI_02577 [Reticulomyxa filosa]|uniref:Protein-serine/threonine phosphatase n=1 Tax=Reticulomyxa filosa TaxID=46433 RepID=X6PA40_RETFI|nr:hypothetical protein RFI_02577 [Reticulomyxa filosa]|eukprot:ETO34517.1 hypothetical protein RFI_02577 [Reticulomyxa filosa]
MTLYVMEINVVTVVRIATKALRRRANTNGTCNSDHAKDLKLLQSIGITHVLNVAHDIPSYHTLSFVGCKHVHLKDEPEQDILFVFSECFDFIDQCVLDRQHSFEKIVQKCMCIYVCKIIWSFFGNNRLQSLAHAIVKNNRIVINPSNFWKQLQTYEQQLHAQKNTKLTGDQTKIAHSPYTGCDRSSEKGSSQNLFLISKSNSSRMLHQFPTSSEQNLPCLDHLNSIRNVDDQEPNTLHKGVTLTPETVSDIGNSDQFDEHSIPACSSSSQHDIDFSMDNNKGEK